MAQTPSQEPQNLEFFSHDLKEALAAFLREHRDSLVNTWMDRVHETPELQARGDISPEASNNALRGFFDAIYHQALQPADFTPLREYVQSDAIESFTSDAACRLHLAFKYTLAHALETQNITPSLLTWTGIWMDEILLRISKFYSEKRYTELQRQENERARVLKATQERVKTLLETMNEGFTAVDTTETVIMFNRRMEQITGFSRDEAIGNHVAQLYTQQGLGVHKDQLARRRRGESSSYELEMSHKDGHSVPVRISGAPLRDDAGHHIGSFAVVTDISEQVEAEERLRQSNREIARLLASEQKRTAHFATINEVARLALSTLDLQEIFRRVVSAVQERFSYYHTSLFLVEEDTGQVVMCARSGAYEPYFPEGYRQDIGRGIVGTVAASGEAIVSNDVKSDPRRIVAFPEEENTHAELCVPVQIGNRIMGALDIQSQNQGIFNENDLASLGILADQIAWVIHNAQLFQEVLQLKEFNEQVLQAIPLPVLMLDEKRCVVFANQSYRDRQHLEPEQLLGKCLDEVVPFSILVQPNGIRAIEEVLRTGQTLHLERQRVDRGPYQNRVVNIVLRRIVVSDDAPLLLAIIEDITESIEKAYQSSLLRQIGQTMQGILDLDRLLYSILTSVTAGSALGFNRAILLQVNEETGMLEGKMGVGPSNREEAGRIWGELARRNLTVDDILENYDTQTTPSDAPLSRAARQIRISLDDPEDLLVRAVKERRTFVVTEDEGLPISLTLWAALATHHFVAVPLVAKDRAIGVIVADNLYSGKSITQESVDLLAAFASHAALALENAELYHRLQQKIDEVQKAYLELENTQKELVQAERLAVIGEMSARMAHEIRNPLSTIGGFARSILKNPTAERLETAGKIIVEETERLEKLLADTLSFSRPSKSSLAQTNPYELFGDIHVFIDDVLQAKRIAYHEELAPDLPGMQLDAAQIKQVLINVLQNAIQAMPEGGQLTVKTHTIRPEGSSTQWLEVQIRDNGEGIAPEHLEQIFSPFFTTKTYGTGLGLAICRKIVQDHGGKLSVESQLGQGTTVSIRLPVN